MDETTSALPNGWMLAKISRVIDKISLTGKKLKKRDYQVEGKLPVVDQGQTFVGGYTNKEELMITCEEPVIVFGDHTRVIKYVDFDFVAGADGVKVIKPLALFYPKLFYYFLQSIRLPEKGYARHFQYLEKSDILLPPLPEQHRIVAKIEELFTKLDAGIEALKKIKIQLKRYHQTVLKYAFAGKLTEEWHKIHKDELEPASVLLEIIKKERKHQLGKKYKELPPVDTTGLPELPEEWRWCRIGDIDQVIMGQSPSGKSYNTQGKGTPLINGPVEFGPSAFSLTKKIKYTTKPAKITKENDLLLCVRGSTTGRMNISGFKACIGRGVAAIRSYVEQWYINYYIHFNEKKFYDMGTGSTFPNITLNQIIEYEIPVPPTSEQKQIIEEIERRFAVADEIEKTVDQSLKQAKRLRQSILKKAFEGKLVPPVCRQAGKDPYEIPPAEEGKYFVYVFKCDDGSLYKGFTTDLLKRWLEHATGKGADWTKQHKPLYLLHWEKVNSLEEAVEREKYLKSGVGREWLKEGEKKGTLNQVLEPANILLVRIKAEKAKFDKEKSSKKIWKRKTKQRHVCR